ncbi:MAG: hypothetical protein WC420_03285 [Candidatus Paceibacterota bacterium]|jgi:hypothetical protein
MIDSKDCRRNRTIKKAIEVANRIILDGSDGSEEETNYLTAKVAEKLMETALHPFSAAILEKDINDHNSGNNA